MKKKWTLKNITDLSNKTIVITGGNSGIGFESAKAFVKKKANVVIACRSHSKGSEAKSKILNTYPDSRISVLELELMDFDSIRMFANKFLDKHNKLDVLLNNAGIMMAPYIRTKEGYETQMFTNHLGHFALTASLIDILKKTPGSRVVNVSSLAHKRGKLDFDNLMFQVRDGHTPLKAYARSKLANLLFTYELQRYFESNNFNSIALAAHPGLAQTELGRYIDKKLFFKILGPVFRMTVPQPSSGALPQIRACVDPGVKGGEFYGPAGFGELSGKPVIVKSSKESYDKESAKKLWLQSEKLSGFTFPSYN